MITAQNCERERPRVHARACVRAHAYKTSDSSNNWLLQFNDTEGGESASGEESKIMTNK